MSGFKVLHISTARSWRGGEQQIAYLCMELREMGVASSIVCIANGPLHNWAIKNGFPALPLKKRSSLDLRFSAKIKAYHQVHQFAVWHAHDAHAHGFAVYAQHFFRAKAKLIVSRRVDFPVASSWLSAFKYNHPSVFRYLAVSDAIAAILRQSLRKKDHIFTVHSANNAQRFLKIPKGQFREEFKHLADRYWIGNVAALTGHKDLFTFLNTAKLVLEEQKDVHFFLAGSGELEKELKLYAEQLGISQRVEFLGFREDIPALLSDLDCFLFSSEMEGLGTSVLDAFASETPVVATSAGGITEMVKHEETGLVYPVKDAPGLKEGILRLRADEALKQKLVSNGLQSLRNFSPQNMAEKTFKHYRA